MTQRLNSHVRRIVILTWVVDIGDADSESSGYSINLCNLSNRNVIATLMADAYGRRKDQSSR